MFNQIAGNQRVKELLLRMLESGRVPGALLFSGEEGIGKKLFALEIAKALNCRSPHGAEACDNCPACARIAKLNYPQTKDPDDWVEMIRTDHADVGMMVAPRRVLKVDQMRVIEREANYRPFEGKARVFLIEDADKLNDQSANALLKILEEPPPTSHVVLLTARPAMLLPTIRSRCQVIRFSPLTVTEIEQYLLHKSLAKEADARLRARLASGSIGRALWRDIESYKTQRGEMLKVLNALAADNDRARLLRSAEELNAAAHKDDYETNLDILEALIRDAWMLSLEIGAEHIVNDDLHTQLSKVARSINGRAANWIAQIEELRENLIVNINRKIATDALFLSLASRGSRVSAPA